MQAFSHRIPVTGAVLEKNKERGACGYLPFSLSAFLGVFRVIETILHANTWITTGGIYQ